MSRQYDEGNPLTFEMDNRTIAERIRGLGISPSLLNWGDEVVSSTKIWFDKEKSEMCADCGVAIPVDDNTDLAEIGTHWRPIKKAVR